jgi:cation transport regulator ChaB
MPKTTKSGKAKKEELPEPLQRSPEKAQRTYAKAHDSAVETYGEGERAHRTAYSAVKHSFEKKGDRWVEKDEKGPSDPRAKDPDARRRSGQKDVTSTYGGVDVEGNSKEELYRRAQDLDVPGRSSMSKHELAEAIARKQG